MESKKAIPDTAYTTEFKRSLVEKALAMCSQAYQAQVKAKLLTQAIMQIEGSKKSLQSLNDKLNREITVRKQVEERIRYMASHDELTGLPNRALFADRLQNAQKLAARNTQKLAVLFIDLDGFKAVNDTFGHKAGDRLLQEIAQRLQSAVRESDTVARVGGDEFIVLINAVHGDADATMVASKIIESVGLPVDLGETQAKVGCSIGISIFPDHSKETEKLIAYADAAMYDIKKSGKNAYAVYQA